MDNVRILVLLALFEHATAWHLNILDILFFKSVFGLNIHKWLCSSSQIHINGNPYTNFSSLTIFVLFDNDDIILKVSR